jgi:hypothetical protein
LFHPVQLFSPQRWLQVARTAVLGFFWLAQAGLAQDSLLLPYRLDYSAETLGLSAEATRYLWQDESGDYILRNKIKAAPLGVTLAELDERSRFTVQGTQVLPLSYSYEQSGLGAEQQHAEFDWNGGEVLSRYADGEARLVLAERVTDKLLFQLQLRQQLLSGQTGPFEFAIVDEDDIEVQRYALVGEERLSTELGEFDTIKLQRIRAEDSPRSTYFWLAKDWHFLLVAIEQTDSRGRKTVLTLRAGEVSGTAIVGE